MGALALQPRPAKAASRAHPAPRRSASARRPASYRSASENRPRNDLLGRKTDIVYTSTTDPGNAYTYDAMGRHVGVARGSGTTTAYGYDGLSRLSSLSHSLSTTNPSGNQTYGLGYTPSSQIGALSTTNGAYLWAASSGAPSFDGEFNSLSLWNGSTGVWATNYGFGGRAPFARRGLPVRPPPKRKSAQKK